MQDIIHNHLIPMVPEVWLDVSVEARKEALKWIHNARVSCLDNVYFRIINALVNDNKKHLIKAFTKKNYSNPDFIERIQHGASIKSVDYIKIAYKYIQYHDQRVITSMFNSFLKLFGFKSFLELADNFDREFVESNMDIEMLVHPILFDYEGVFSRRFWESQAGEDTIKFIIKFYPDFINKYVIPFANDVIDEPYNSDTRCMKMVLDLSTDILDKTIIDKALKKLESLGDIEHWDELVDDPDEDTTPHNLRF